MKAKIHVNRHIQGQNIKNKTKNPAISIVTYLGTISATDVQVDAPSRIVQDSDHPLGCGATIWMETLFESLTIDGIPASRDMFKKKK